MRDFIGFTEPAPADATPPSPISNLASIVSGKAVMLSWAPATDNIGIDHYDIYADGMKVDLTVGTLYTFVNQISGLHIYGVSAVDKAGNQSDKITISVTVSDDIPPSEFSRMLALLQENNQLLKEIRAHFG
jgi:chitin-binding protein